MMRNSRQTTPIWSRLVLLLAAGAAVAAAVLVVGAPSASTQTSERTITAERGVVQSTVSGSGNLQPSNQVDVNFATSGTLTHLYVKAGQHVYADELLAKLDPTDADVNLQQAQANLQSAQAKLDQVESDPSAPSSQSAASASGVASVGTPAPTVAVDDKTSGGLPRTCAWRRSTTRPRCGPPQRTPTTRRRPPARPRPPRRTSL